MTTDNTATTMESRRLKRQAEIEILRIINEYESRTGLSVTRICTTRGLILVSEFPQEQTVEVEMEVQL